MYIYVSIVILLIYYLTRYIFLSLIAILRVKYLISLLLFYEIILFINDPSGFIFGPVLLCYDALNYHKFLKFEETEFREQRPVKIPVSNIILFLIIKIICSIEIILQWELLRIDSGSVFVRISAISSVLISELFGI